MTSGARAEAERRVVEAREQVGLTVQEQARYFEGFVQGAEWQAEQEATWNARLEAFAAVTPCSCNAQRERAKRAEVKLAAFRHLVDEKERERGDLTVQLAEAEARLAAVRAEAERGVYRGPVSPGSHAAVLDAQARRILDLIDGEGVG